MAFMKNEAAFQCKGILDRILLLMKLYQSVLHLEQFHVEERGRGREGEVGREERREKQTARERE